MKEFSSQELRRLAGTVLSETKALVFMKGAAAGTAALPARKIHSPGLKRPGYVQLAAARPTRARPADGTYSEIF